MGKVVGLLRSRFALALLGASLLLGGAATWALTNDMTLVATLHEPAATHADQSDLVALVKGGNAAQAMTEAFGRGDTFFETSFNAIDGGGANVGDGSRYSHVPRADLTGPGQWASHTPSRATGPNAMACTSCHEQGFDDGSGSAVDNVHRDPLHSGNLKQFIQRNTPHTFGLGPVQRLAEEVTADLLRDRDGAAAQACVFGSSVGQLSAKGINFGSIRATRVSSFPCAVSFDTSNVRGVSTDLVVRPFQWKGKTATIREFTRDAANNEIGMQPVETTGDNVDGDGDGVVNEMTIGDVTAVTVYLASQPRPTNKLELVSFNLIDPLPADEVAAIKSGTGVFAAAGCASCHVPKLLLNDPTFSEPSRSGLYRDRTFPAGQDPVSRGVDPRFAIRVDLTADQPDNRIRDANGNVVYKLGSLTTDSQRRAVVELFGDLKRHYMGTKLAESIDEIGTGAATFLTRNLWGVGSTAPYLHDGRATTLTEAILEHGGEAAGSRAAFVGLSSSNQKFLLAYLNNLVLYKISDERGVVVPPPPTVHLTSPLRFRR